MVAFRANAFTKIVREQDKDIAALRESLRQAQGAIIRGDVSDQDKDFVDLLIQRAQIACIILDSTLQDKAGKSIEFRVANQTVCATNLVKVLATLKLAPVANFECLVTVVQAKAAADAIRGFDTEEQVKLAKETWQSTRGAWHQLDKALKRGVADLDKAIVQREKDRVAQIKSETERKQKDALKAEKEKKRKADEDAKLLKQYGQAAVLFSLDATRHNTLKVLEDNAALSEAIESDAQDAAHTRARAPWDCLRRGERDGAFRMCKAVRT
jgi:hypothetical protein